MLKITNARVIVTCPGRNFVTLKIETDQGVYGIGDATLNGRELAVVSYLQDHVCPALIGRDAHRIEDIWQYLYRGAYWRRGPVTMTAIAAVDMALWDIKAKAANMPLYQILGRAPRPSDFAAHLDIDLDSVVDALAASGCFAPVSLDAPTHDDAESLGPRLGITDPGFDHAEARAALLPVLARLSARERLIVEMRFFRGCTQSEIGKEIGVTQMQVSRLLTRLLARLRKELDLELVA